MVVSIAVLLQVGRQVAEIIGRGRDAFLGDDAAGGLLRDAATTLLVRASQGCKRLPDHVRSQSAGIDWAGVEKWQELAIRMDGSNGDLLWSTLTGTLTQLLECVQENQSLLPDGSGESCGAASVKGSAPPIQPLRSLPSSQR